MKKNLDLNKSFYFISFLPAIAYWYLEENYPLRYALLGGLVLASIEILAEKILTKHIHSISKFNFMLILILGSISLIGDEGIWFKLQPSFTGVFFGGYLLVQNVRGQGVIQDMANAMNSNPPPDFILKILESHTSIFLILYGIFMGFVAFFLDTDKWLFFKTIGFYISMMLFFLIEVFFIRRKLKIIAENNIKANVLKKF